MCNFLYQMLILSASLFIEYEASAGTQSATVTNLVGAARILKNPATEVSGDGIHVRYLKLYYVYEAAKIGSKVEPGEIVQTSINSKVRLIFDNGDQLAVGETSSYRLEIQKPGKQIDHDSAQLELLFGRVRAIIDKEGPRNRLKIRTRVAVMGVRGTDFSIEDLGSSSGVELQVYRGKVEVKPAGAAAESKMVQTGGVAEIKTPSSTSTTVALRPVTKEDLHETHQRLFVSSNLDASTAIPEVADLEKRAIASTLKDIKASNPKEFDKRVAGLIRSAQVIDAEVLASLFDKAERRDPNDHSPLVKPSGVDVESQIDENYQNRIHH